jgi:methyl-accepting chemotaxis protein
MEKFNVKYSIKEKLLIGFSIVLGLMIIMIFATYLLNNQITNYTNEIRNVEAPLELMVQQVIGYDAMLTGNVHEALLHVEAGEMSYLAIHKTKYDEIGAKLDGLLKNEARDLIGQSKRSNEQKEEVYGYLKRLDEVNLALVDLETRAFSAMENGDAETARSLVVSEEYNNYKSELYSLYLKWADAESVVTESYRSNVLANSRNVIFINFGIGALAIILGIIVALLITLSIINPLKKLRFVAEELSAGNLDVKIPAELKKTNGEIGRLAHAYGVLIANSRRGMEEFVRAKFNKKK